MGDKAFTAIVSGIVQGVAFRYYTRKVALELNVKGTVRNLMSGRVEVTAEGDEEALRALAAWLEHGPSAAHVERVDLTWKPFLGWFDSFDIVG
jgi:acylphosphatase